MSFCNHFPCTRRLWDLLLNFWCFLYNKSYHSKFLIKLSFENTTNDFFARHFSPSDNLNTTYDSTSSVSNYSVWIVPLQRVLWVSLKRIALWLWNSFRKFSLFSWIFSAHYFLSCIHYQSERQFQKLFELTLNTIWLTLADLQTPFEIRADELI